MTDNDSLGLADPTAARSNCGVGVVMNLDGTRTHDVVRDGIDLLGCLEHRGTTGADPDTGDGAGVLLQIPHEFFDAVLDVSLPPAGEYAVGGLFLPRERRLRARLVRLVERTLEEEGLEVFAWRSVPTGEAGLGETARASEPAIRQVFVRPAEDLDAEAFDRRLYLARRTIQQRVRDRGLDHEQCYVVSLDRQTVVYKGLLTASQLGAYYTDLTDDHVRSQFAMVHARFSTNTLGAWHLAHPYRTLIHNGEFNTIQGNVNWMRARETDLADEAFGEEIDRLRPIIEDPDQSDTASVDNALELLLETGRELPHALRMLIPEAWRAPETGVTGDRRAFYDYHASLIEPWDGPALVAATDGRRVGAVLDRNGLRPCRYDILEDDRLVMSSEVGALPYDPSEIRERGRLQPGQCFLADPEAGRVVPDAEVFEEIADPTYAEWVDREQRRLADLEAGPDRGSIEELGANQVAHGYTYDELEHLLEPMAETGVDPVGSMGDDTPLSVLSQFNRPLFSYFKQLFAQVSNPPIDYIREELVTSLETRLGEQRNLLAETPAHARQLVLDSPILTDDDLAAIAALDGTEGLSATVLDTTYDPDETDLEAALDELRREAADAAESHDIAVLSDRAVGPDRVPIPSLLAVGGVHHHLVRTGARTDLGLVVESGDPRTVHQVAALIGYGAGAVNPYLAYETVAELTEADRDRAVAAYRDAVETGLLKTMAKMGISTVESYRGAQIFEAVGLSSSVIEEYFEGTANRTEGIGLDAIEADALDRHALAWADDAAPERVGEFENRTGGRHHRWNPKTVGTLQQAVRQGDYEAYREFAAMVNDQSEQLQTMRGLLTLESDREPVPIENVEPVASIVERFETAAMSLGSLSPEMHENNAIAMNRLGATANTGEGGEPPERFDTEKACATKQVASGRFGVTATYLSAADQLQIKMAQGSKPGEGGHLPGGKVNEMIAHVRYATPGVGLISPPPLHDIYSIEDLKQLIYDLRAANPEAEVSVKLVAEDGVGIIAAGVAKAEADVVHVSGHSGGTGASPKTSIKHAGVPWELGVAETHQLLSETGLRDRIRVTTDGGLMTGRDVAVAALLGAEGYVFGTASLVSSGCVMARQCHENTCPVGVATQDESLRDRFPGQPQHVINYMTFIAAELRELMAELGFETVEEMIGHADCLRQRETGHDRADGLDLSAVLAPVDGPNRVDTDPQPERSLDDRLDDELLEAVGSAIETGEPTTVAAEIDNTDRAVGATISHRISREHGTDGLPDGTITARLDGTAGQSFGAFLQSGVTLSLTGSANDYLGKGLSGGRLLARTPPTAGYDAAENVVAGNVALYGATQGECYVNGAVGERFAVRNSGAHAVVESVGDHACEYMTGGVVVVLGETGRNVAAGMSGGVAYVYDPDDELADRANTEMVTLSTTLEERDRAVLTRLVENHAAYTGSQRARRLLETWPETIEAFTRVMPDAYAEVIADRSREDVRTDPPAPAAPDGSGERVRGGAD